MRWADEFIAVDWGTTNRRAYLIDRSGTCVSRFEDDCGVLSVDSNDFTAAADDIRARLGDLPLLLAGMIGSTRGWVEAPYVPCPASLDDLAQRLTWVEPGRTAIVPGLSVRSEDHADVMRGEEVQLFGALDAGLIPATSFVCHPGTHNKWITVEDGRIVSFRTVMTGEMFNMLRDRGILADLLTQAAIPDDAFRGGVRRGFAASALTAELFTVRARVLLGDLPRESAASFTSGLLIGIDLGIGLKLAGDADIIVMGRPELTRLYATGAAEAGRQVNELDGSTAFLAGAVALARRLT
jgi:2-dehydro-3-deoxygalactonokinase